MTGLRITAGALKGRRVPVPRGPVRPTSARAREAFFDSIGSAIVGATFLDLFAGSGVFSFEAVSRGARRVVAVDSSAATIRQIRRLASDWGVPVEGVRANALRFLEAPASPAGYDVVYADPPYDFHDYPRLLEALGRMPQGDPGLVAIEHRSGIPPFEGAMHPSLRLRKTSRYGDVSLSLFEPAEDSRMETTA